MKPPLADRDIVTAFLRLPSWNQPRAYGAREGEDAWHALRNFASNGSPLPWPVCLVADRDARPQGPNWRDGIIVPSSGKDS